MSAAKLSLAELRDRLHGHGETAPKAWTRAQILLRLVELEGDHILKTEKEEPTPLRQWEVRINQASKKKAELQTLLAKDLHVDVNPNWTIDMLRLKAQPGGSSLRDSGSQERSGGLREMVPLEVSRGADHRPSILPMGHHGWGGRCLPSPVLFGPVATVSAFGGASDDAKDKVEASSGQPRTRRR